MPEFRLQRPLLPSHYRVLLEPPDDQGDETLSFVSLTRRVKLRGHSFREFRQRVVPLLYGRHEVAQIAEACSDEFAAQDLDDALALLAGQGLLRDAALETSVDDVRRQPQWNQWHDLGLGTGRGAGAPGRGDRGRRRCQRRRCSRRAGAGRGRRRQPAPDRQRAGPCGRRLSGRRLRRRRARPRARRCTARSAHARRRHVASPSQPQALPDDDAVAAVVQGADLVVCCPTTAAAAWPTSSTASASGSNGRGWRQAPRAPRPGSAR